MIMRYFVAVTILHLCAITQNVFPQDIDQRFLSRVFDSVVVVSVKRYDTNHNAFHVTGTGVVVMSEEDELLILTAYHLFDNQEYFVDRISVHVYGHDNEILVGGLYKIDRRNDLALIKIASSIPLDAIPISDPASGDLVTMISGSESADRHIGNGFVTKVDHDVVWFAGFDVHAGNSGSPLLNRNGHLVGIVIGEEKVAVRGNTIVGIFEDTWGIFGLTTNWHPNAIIVAPDLAEEGRVVYFDGSQSEDIDGRIVSYRWKFDDGSVEIGPAAEKIVSTPGRFGATLTVKDDKDQESITYKEITVIKRIRDIILVTVGGEGNVVIDEGVHGFGAGLIFEHNDFSIDGEFGTTVPNRILGSVEDALEVKREFDGVLLSAQYGYKFGAEGDGGELGAFVAVGRDTAIANTSTPEFHAADIPTDLVIDEETGVPTLVYEPLYIRQEYETEATLFPVLQAHLNYSFRSGLTLLDISGVLTSAAKSSRETHHHYRRIGENGSEEELPQRTVFASLPVLEGMVLAQAGLVFPISETFAIQAVAEGGILTSIGDREETFHVSEDGAELSGPSIETQSKLFKRVGGMISMGNRNEKIAWSILPGYSWTAGAVEASSADENRASSSKTIHNIALGFILSGGKKNDFGLVVMPDFDVVKTTVSEDFVLGDYSESYNWMDLGSIEVLLCYGASHQALFDSVSKSRVEDAKGKLGREAEVYYSPKIERTRNLLFSLWGYATIIGNRNALNSFHSVLGPVEIFAGEISESFWGPYGKSVFGFQFYADIIGLAASLKGAPTEGIPTLGVDIKFSRIGAMYRTEQIALADYDSTLSLREGAYRADSELVMSLITEISGRSESGVLFDNLRAAVGIVYRDSGLNSVEIVPYLRTLVSFSL